MVFLSESTYYVLVTQLIASNNCNKLAQKVCTRRFSIRRRKLRKKTKRLFLAETGEKEQSQKLSKIILVAIASQCFETHFWTKISKSKYFSRINFFCAFVIFSWNCQNSRNWQRQRILVEIFLDGNDSERYKSYRTTKNLEIENSSPTQFFNT